MGKVFCEKCKAQKVRAFDEDEDQVRDYFTCANLRELFQEPCEWTQAQLDRAANWVIEHRYGMTEAK